MKEGHIYIDDVIQPNQHLLVKQQLAKLGVVDKVVLHIQSPGGSVYGGYNTYHVLKSLGVPIKTIVEGEAQSMASFLAIAGDEVEIRNPSVFMMHMPSMEMGGDADDLQSGANELRNIEDFMIQAYADKAKKSPEEVREMMKKTTVLNATQAVEAGFADKVTEPLKAVALGKQVTMKITKEITDLFDRVAVMFTDASKKFGPIAMELKTKVGGQDAMIL
jgi:ATP-dependent protease ClpP protease subunit